VVSSLEPAEGIIDFTPLVPPSTTPSRPPTLSSYNYTGSEETHRVEEPSFQYYVPKDMYKGIKLFIAIPCYGERRGKGREGKGGVQLTSSHAPAALHPSGSCPLSFYRPISSTHIPFPGGNIHAAAVNSLLRLKNMMTHKPCTSLCPLPP
jgi:hypothetical protein